MPRKQITHQQVMKKALQNKKFAQIWQEDEMKREIAMAVIEQRIKRKLTQTELADKIGIKQPSLARIESGSLMPSLYTLNKIASAFGKNIQIRFA